MMSKRYWAAMAVAFWTVAAQAASLSVTDVKIAQRYPWNGLVDITYTVNCDDPNKDVWVYPVGYDADKAQSVALMPQYLSGEGASNAVHAGTCRMTWDMARQMGKNYNRAAFSVTLHAYCNAAPYMVIDLSAGSNAETYPVSYLAEIPEGGWNDEYKTTKMVFRLIPPGTFMMGSPTNEVGRRIYDFWNDSMRRYYYAGGAEALHRVTLTRPFYCTIFELTNQQYYLLQGGDTVDEGRKPKDRISFVELRGSTLGTHWPDHQQVDANSIVGKLRLKTGITIDLPTEAQWEYACRGGCEYASPTEITSYGSASFKDVGTKRANSFGIYDMLGNVCEWCLDGYVEDLGFADRVDPVGSNSSRHVVRGGCARGRSVNYSTSDYFIYSESACRPASRLMAIGYETSYKYITQEIKQEGFGCRLVALPMCK